MELLSGLCFVEFQDVMSGEIYSTPMEKIAPQTEESTGIE